MARILKLRDAIKPVWFQAELAEGGLATDAMMAKINALPGVLKPLQASDVIVRGNAIANDKPFKDGRRTFRADALPEIAALLPGVKGIANHASYGDAHDPRPLARTFDAGVAMDASGTSWVRHLFFMLNRPLGQEVAAAIDGGHVTEASLGIYFGTLDCSICGEGVNEWTGSCPNDHLPGATYDGTTCIWEIDDIKAIDEWSMLALEGMVDGTHYFMAAGKEPPKDAIEVDVIEAAFAKREKAPEPSAWDRLFPARAARREKFQSFMNKRKGSPAPQSGS